MSKLGVVEDTLFVPMLGRIYAAEHCPQILYDKKALCTSQQKVDTFFIFYTLKTEHSTPYIVLVSNSLMSMQVFLH